MQIPAAMFIEAASDGLKKLDKDVQADQLKELHEACGQKSDDFQEGYQLGLQVAREMLETNGLLITKGIEADKIL